MGAITVNGIKIDNPQIGGWYQGRQLWTDPGGNWTLSEPGQINQYSNQQGAGGLVSKEVIAQTNPANVAYIEQQRAKMGLPSSPATGVPQGQAQQPTAYNPGQTSGAGVDFSAMTPTPTIDLPSLYKNLFESSGVSGKEQELLGLEKQFLEARNKISDNPFLSASMVDKRLARLQGKYDEKTSPLKNEIAMKKADIETQLNLQTKQFDINSQSAKQALDYFNTLLSAGALDNASGEDIANLTRATGLSSTLIQSAVNANKAKNTETQVITSTADDGTVTATVINPKTGQIINQSNLGQVGNREGNGSGLSVSQQAEADKEASRQNLIGDVQRGATLRALVGHYSGVMDVEEIYRLYNTYSEEYGSATESLDEVKQGIYYDR